MKMLLKVALVALSTAAHAGNNTTIDICGKVLSCYVYGDSGVVGQASVPVTAVEYPGDDRDSRFGPYSLCEAHASMQLNVNLGTFENPSFPYGVKIDVVEDRYSYEFFYCADKEFKDGLECSDKSGGSYKGGFIYVNALTPIRIPPFTRYVVDCQLN